MKLIITALVVLSFLSFTPAVSAAKPRVRGAAPKSGGAVVATGYSRAKLSRPTNSVLVTFMNLSAVSGITYTLSYVANGIAQGAVGSMIPSGSGTESRDLYFGTCSHGVCTPHRGIQQAVLLVETRLKSGGTHTKRYKIKY